MATAVFVMTHKKYEEPKDPVYHTLQVGRAAGDHSLPYRGDDSGDNISYRNWLFGELTGIYWIWKNVEEYDHIGICHYRRYFLNENGELMRGDEYDRILSDYDMIVPKPSVSDQTNWEGYAESHNGRDLMTVKAAVDKLTPEFSGAFQEMLDAKSSYYANLAVMPHTEFNSYCEWIFRIFAEAEREIDVTDYDNYHKRVYGFLSELLLNTWIIRKQYRVYETEVGITSEKAETTELKGLLSDYVRKGDFSGGRKCYYEFMEKRPDVRLSQSDLSGEIPLMEIILYILEQEQQRGQKGFASVSMELPKLIQHYRRVVSILKALGDGSAGEADVQYILTNHLSAVATEIILRNTAGINGDIVRKILGINE